MSNLTAEVESFYIAWIQHVEFERSQEQADALAKLHGLEKAPPLADPDHDTLTAFSAIMATAGQELLSRLAKILQRDDSEPAEKA